MYRSPRFRAVERARAQYLKLGELSDYEPAISNFQAALRQVFRNFRLTQSKASAFFLSMHQGKKRGWFSEDKHSPDDPEDHMAHFNVSDFNERLEKGGQEIDFGATLESNYKFSTMLNALKDIASEKTSSMAEVQEQYSKLGTLGDSYDRATYHYADELAQVISYLNVSSQTDVEKYFTEKYHNLGGFSKNMSCKRTPSGCNGDHGC